MDILYTGDIPEEFYFADFHENYIDLYDRQKASSGETDTLPYYRLYFYNGKLFYTQDSLTTDTATNFIPIKTSNKWYDRPDCLNILMFTLVISVATIWITNIFTSVFKRGGLLGGLF